MLRHPATSRQRESLEALMERAELTWESLVVGADCLADDAIGPWDGALTALEADVLIEWMVETVGGMA